MRNSFISSLVEDAKIRDETTGNEDNRQTQLVALYREKTATSGAIRNILAALLGVAIGLLVIWIASE